MLSWLAVLSDSLHVLFMIAWAFGLPLLFWHRWPRLSFACTLYAVAFVILSQLSHQLLGECFFTTLSRSLWASAGVHADGTFTGRLVNWVAGVRPTTETAVLIWEIAIVGTAVAAAWSLLRHLRRRPPSGKTLSHPC